MRRHLSSHWVPPQNLGFINPPWPPVRPQGPPPAANNFEFYDNNGGTVAAIAGEDYVLIACDTRLSSGRVITSRDMSKLFQLTPNVFMGSCGCFCDSQGLFHELQKRIADYEYENTRCIQFETLANLTSLLMYSRRAYPYYVSTMIAGMDRDGHGGLYYFDPLGHYVRYPFRSAGTGSSIMEPIMFSDVGVSKMLSKSEMYVTMDVDGAREFLIEAFATVAKRDMFTGDSVIIRTINENSIDEITEELAKY